MNVYGDIILGVVGIVSIGVIYTMTLWTEDVLSSRLDYLSAQIQGIKNIVEDDTEVEDTTDHIVTMKYHEITPGNTFYVIYDNHREHNYLLLSPYSQMRMNVDAIMGSYQAEDGGVYILVVYNDEPVNRRLDVTISREAYEAFARFINSV